jgi:hypothetical protein
VGRVQAEPAAAPPTVSSRAQISPATTTSSHKRKEQQATPAPLCTILPYEDIQMDKPVLEVDAFDFIQGTLFHNFMEKEPLKNIIILEALYNTNGVHTLFVCMGNYVYAYQDEVVIHILENYNRGHPLPILTRQQINTTIHLKDKIMGPIHIYNTVDEPV